MSATLRLIVKAPNSVQVTEDGHFQDTTRYETRDIPCPDDVAEFLSGYGKRHPDLWPVVVGAEVHGGFEKKGGAE